MVAKYPDSVYTISEDEEKDDFAIKGDVDISRRPRYGIIEVARKGSGEDKSLKHLQEVPP